MRPQGTSPLPGDPSGVRQPGQAVDEQNARRRRRWWGPRRVAGNHDGLGRRSVRVEVEGVAGVQVPTGHRIHSRSRAPNLAALTEGIARRKSLRRSAWRRFRFGRRTQGRGLCRTRGQSQGRGGQATRHKGSGCSRGGKPTSHRLPFDRRHCGGAGAAVKCRALGSLPIPTLCTDAHRPIGKCLRTVTQRVVWSRKPSCVRVTASGRELLEQPDGVPGQRARGPSQDPCPDVGNRTVAWRR